MLAAGLLAAGAATAQAAAYVWPIGNGTTPDLQNTPFGPRVNFSHWDMHDGVDLPGTVGIPLHAVRSGTVFLAGPAGPGYSSRHVVLEVTDPADGRLFVMYFHLDAIDPAVVPGAYVTQGQVIGALGDDDATYPHVHLEFRGGNGFQPDRVHPLRHLPYADTANYPAPASARAAWFDGGPAVRLPFTVADKEEPDLARVEADLLAGASVVATRVVDFADTTTIAEGNDDALAFTSDIALEGYQRSNMGADGWTDLDYGILLRNLPAGVDGVRARVTDLGGNTAAGPVIVLAVSAPFEAAATFDDAALPPAGWTAVTSAAGTGTTLLVEAGAGNAGTPALRARDASTAEAGPQPAAVEIPLPAARLRWTAQAWIRIDSLGLADGQSAYLLHFLSGGALAVAARVRVEGGTPLASIVARKSDGSLTGVNSAAVVVPGAWARWSLSLVRLGTRMTTAILGIDGSEVRRFTWDAETVEPDAFRAGIGLNWTGATAEVRLDDVLVTEKAPPAFVPFTPPPAAPPATALGEIAATSSGIAGYRPGVDRTRFERVPPGTSMEVYSRTWRRIRTFRPADAAGGVLTWDLHDGAGAPVPSGVYLCVFRDREGNTRTLHVALTR